MRWDEWHGYLFPVTCNLDQQPDAALIWDFCPACGGPLPLGVGPIVRKLKKPQ